MDFNRIMRRTGTIFPLERWCALTLARIANGEHPEDIPALADYGIWSARDTSTRLDWWLRTGVTDGFWLQWRLIMLALEQRENAPFDCPPEHS